MRIFFWSYSPAHKSSTPNYPLLMFFTGACCFLSFQGDLLFLFSLLVVTSPMMTDTKLGGLDLSAVEPVSFWTLFLPCLGVK